MGTRLTRIVLLAGALGGRDVGGTSLKLYSCIFIFRSFVNVIWGRCIVFDGINDSRCEYRQAIPGARKNINSGKTDGALTASIYF